MVQKICNKVDYVYEAVSLLRHLGQKESYEETVSNLSRRYITPLKGKELEKAFLLKVEKEANIFLKQELPLIEVYFSGTEKKSSVAELLLLWDEFICQRIETLENLKEYYLKFSDKEYAKEFGNRILNYGNSIQENCIDEVAENELDVIRFIMKLEISAEEKYRIQEYYMNRKIHLERIFQLIEKTILFLKNYENELQEITNRFAAYWEQTLQGKPFNQYFIEKLEIGVTPNAMGVILTPSVFIPNQAAFHGDMNDDGTYKRVDYASVGIWIGDYLDITHSQEKQDVGYLEDVCQNLKLLSDKSKFEILCYIRDKSAYGAELAKHLNLTTATISHHMNALFQSGLIKIEKVNTKAYYQIDKKRLIEILDYCKQALLGEEY